jgi:hypothetical protein
VEASPLLQASQIHRQENEAPTIIDTIATGYLRTGPTKSVTLPGWLRGYFFLRFFGPSGLPILPDLLCWWALEVP